MASTSRRADGPVVNKLSLCLYTQSDVHGIFLVCCLPISCLRIKWFFFLGVSMPYVREGAWFCLDFHVVLETSFMGTIVLFKVLCSGVSVSLFGFCVTGGNCPALGRASCRYCWGPWRCVMGMIHHAYHWFFCLSRDFWVFPLGVWDRLLRLVRSIILVTIFITIAAVL